MPAKIVMVNGASFVVEMDIDEAGKEVFTGTDREVSVKTARGERVYLNRNHVAYVEAIPSPKPRVNRG